MILHFHADVLPGETAYINIDFDHENYNFNIYPESHYIEVSREDLDAIYKEIDFNMYWHEDNLQKDHDTTVEEMKENLSEDLPWQ